MTCIAGMVGRDGKVWVGADAAGVDGWTIVTRKDLKVFRLGSMLIGCTTSFRMIDLIRFKMPGGDQFAKRDLHEYLATTWIDRLRVVLGEGGMRRTEHGVETGGSFLLGWQGRLFTVDSDFQVGEPLDGYAACGSGEAVALGALSLAHDKGLDADAAVALALRAAERHNIGVRGPFTVLEA